MIRSLRRRHAAMVPVLAVVLPLGVALALSGRRDPASGGTWPAELSGPDTEGAESLWRSEGALEESGISLELELLEVGRGRRLRAMTAANSATPPDLLVYWAPGDLPDGGELPVGARYLGTLRGARPTVFELPNEASREPGTLVGHSLAWDQRVFTAALPEVEGGPDAGDDAVPGEVDR